MFDIDDNHIYNIYIFNTHKYSTLIVQYLSFVWPDFSAK